MLYRKSAPLDVALGVAKLDVETAALAERACFLGAAQLPMSGVGPSACGYAGRVALDGLAGRVKDLSRALTLFEAGCEQELEIGAPGAGLSCWTAARLYEGQPVLGDEVADARPIDTEKALRLFRRACEKKQRDACERLARMADAGPR